MSHTNLQKFDNLLAAFAQSHKDLESLFDTFFLWLRLRTDIFHIRSEKDNLKGFDEGDAERILLKIFRKHQQEYRDTQQSSLDLEPTDSKPLEPGPTTPEKSSLPHDIAQNKEVQPSPPQSHLIKDEEKQREITTSSLLCISHISKIFYRDDSKIKETINQMLTNNAICTKVYWPDEPEDLSLSVEISNFESAQALRNAIKNKKFSNKFLWVASDKDEGQGQDEVDVELITYTSDPTRLVDEDKLQDEAHTSCKASKARDNHISSWNGAVTNEYVWSQTIDEISLEFYKISKPVKKSDIKIIVGSNTFQFEHKGNIIKSAKLFDKVIKNEVVWSIEDNSKVLITLFKMQETWWSSVFEGDESIDPTKIESVKHISEYDEATQAKVHQMVLEQSMKSNPNKPPF